MSTHKICFPAKIRKEYYMDTPPHLSQAMPSQSVHSRIFQLWANGIPNFSNSAIGDLGRISFFMEKKNKTKKKHAILLQSHTKVYSVLDGFFMEKFSPLK